MKGRSRTAQGEIAVNREYKDRLFRFIFGAAENREYILSLYNALRGSEYKNADEIRVTTLDDVIYMGMKNDVSFILASDMNLFEHQSTYNPNIPLRGFSYFARMYEQYIAENGLDLYGTKLVKIPVPRYVVFYNGQRECGERTELRLSDAFMEKAEGYEWTATMLNINRGYNRDLMAKCRPLREYSDFVARARENYKTGMSVEQAVDEAVKAAFEWECLGEFMKKHRSEVKAMFLTEYDEELHERTCWEEGRKQGKEEGIIIGTVNTLRELGRSDEEICDALEKTYNLSADDVQKFV